MSASKRRSDEIRLIGDRLSAAGRTGFIGRERECSRFRTALDAGDAPTVVYVHGTGGVGKTTLLREFAQLAADAGRPVLALDARHITPTRRGLLEAFAEALGQEVRDPQQISVPDRSLVLVDTYERLAALDGWIRDAVLPWLPAGVLIVLGGREKPAPQWSVDVAWSRLTWIVELENFARPESEAFLRSRGVAQTAHQAVLDFTHGHPLALSLVAGVVAAPHATARFDPVDAPDVIRQLLALFLDAVPDDYREALDISVVARVTTERLLVDLLGAEDGRRAFDWLRGQTFIEGSALGLYPHDLARDVLLADAQWRDRDRSRRIARRVYSALHGYIGTAHGRDRQRLQMDALYVTRTTPTNVSVFDWRRLDDVYLEPAAAEDRDWILEVVGRHEGAESAALARAWWQAQADSFQVFRDVDDKRFGFVALVDLHHPGIVKTVRDPAADAAMAFVARHAPVRPDEPVVHMRWWMHAEAYQGVTAAINLAAMHVVSHCVTRPRLAWNFVAMADPSFWAAHFAGVNFARVPEADFEVGSRRYGVFAHEWRIDPPADWLMATRTAMPFGDRRERAEASPVAGEAEFTAAVHAAVRDYTRPEALAENPLRFSRLLQNERDPDARARTLQQLLRQAAGMLEATPRDQKLSRVLRHTYFEPLGTQELVAERLDLPFSTYRHQLGRAIDRIARWLWLRERALRRG